MANDDVDINIQEMKGYFEKNQYKLIAGTLIILAIVGMWFCYIWGFTHGAYTICENSNGIPVVSVGDKVKDGKCLIEYDPLSITNNNLGVSKEQVEALKAMR